MKNQIMTFLAGFLILLLSTNIYAQDEIKEHTLGDYFGKNFSIQLLAGFSSLKVLPDFFIEDQFPELPRITMNTYGFRFGKRSYSKISTSSFWELSFSSSKGILKLDYPGSYFTGGEYVKEVNITNTMFGGAYGMWIPIFTRLDSRSFVLSPKAILLNIKVGIDVMIIRENDNSEKSGFVTYNEFDEETIEGGDRVLFSIGAGIDYLIMKNLMLKLDAMIGAYPVSGPGNAEGEATGPPDTWGNNRMVLFGLEFLL